MHIHSNKTQENKSQSVANDLSRKPSGIESTFQFVDNRPETRAQRKLQEKANISPQTKKTAQLQAKVSQLLSSVDSKVVQRVTDLKVQQGPSCWLFVLEAIAKSKGVGTKYLSMAMHAYPESEDAEQKKREEAQDGNNISKRAAALELIVENCTEMIAKLHNWKVGEGGQRDNQQIEKRIVERYARQSFASDASVSYIQFDPNTSRVNVDTVINEYVEAKRRARTLADIVGAGDAPQMLLNTGAQMIDKDQDENDVHLGLSNQNLPSYVSIRKRFKLRQNDAGNTVNFTGRNSGEMQDTHHAILLDAYDAANKIVTYKDPNYGNVEIKVTHTQFQEMAGDSEMRMLPFFADGLNKSRMADVKD